MKEKNKKYDIGDTFELTIVDIRKDRQPYVLNNECAVGNGFLDDLKNGVPGNRMIGQKIERQNEYIKKLEKQNKELKKTIKAFIEDVEYLINEEID